MSIARNKASVQLLDWHKQWEKIEHRRKSTEDAEQRSAAAASALDEARSLLLAGLMRKPVLTRRSKCFAFETKAPVKPTPVKLPKKPSPKVRPSKPRSSQKGRPDDLDARYEPALSFLALFSKRVRSANLDAARSLYLEDLRRWEARQEKDLAMRLKAWEISCEKTEDQKRQQLEKWGKAVVLAKEKTALADKKHSEKHKRWTEEKEAHEEQVRCFFDRYKAGEPDAVVQYLTTVLDQSFYPDWFPHKHTILYDVENDVCVVDSCLPLPTDLPGTQEVSYVQTRDAFVEKPISARERDRMYDSLVYQVALRTLYECHGSTSKKIIRAVVFNGFVENVDLATGKPVRPCILSVQASRGELAEVDLLEVDPKECVRKLKGVGSSKLHALVPIAPILVLDTEDSRFVPGREVIGELDMGTNLAAMPWDDFEHLIRDLFEQHFADRGATVRVTQASRDRGVDAIVFDPDPITGGKIILQAKRYTNTVPAAAVRELWGTVDDENAKLGILVTTSSFGPDAIKWAADKPLTLLSGGNLLKMLEDRGHKAYINLPEAKQILKAEEERRSS